MFAHAAEEQLSNRPFSIQLGSARKSSRKSAHSQIVNRSYLKRKPLELRTLNAIDDLLENITRYYCKWRLDLQTQVPITIDTLPRSENDFVTADPFIDWLIWELQHFPEFTVVDERPFLLDICHLLPSDTMLKIRAGEGGIDELRHLAREGILIGHKEWCKSTDQVYHPLNRPVAAWYNRPMDVSLDSRVDNAILPLINAEFGIGEKERGIIFSGQLPDSPYVETNLPALFQPKDEKRVPLLDLVDRAGGAVLPQGPGVPLEARIIVRCLMCVRPGARQTFPYHRIHMTLRDLVRGVYPRGFHRNTQWPRLRQALLNLNNYCLRSPAGNWYPANVRHMDDNPTMKDTIIIEVAFPAHHTNGPQVPLAALDRLSTSSAPRWRALIAARTLTFRAGITTVPRYKNDRNWKYVERYEDYPIFTARDRRRLAYGAESEKNHRGRDDIDGAWRDLPGMAVVDEDAHDPKTNERGWRIVPEEAVIAHEKISQVF